GLMPRVLYVRHNGAAADSDLIQVREHVGRVRINAVSASSLQFTSTVAAGENADAESSCTLCSKKVPDAVADHVAAVGGETKPVGGCQEEVGIGFGVSDIAR